MNAVVPHEELLPRTYEIAQAIGALDQSVVRRHVSLYRRADGLPFTDALALEREVADEWAASRNP